MRYWLYPHGLNDSADVTRHKTEESALRAWRKAGKTCPNAIIYDHRDQQWQMTYAEAMEKNNPHINEQDKKPTYAELISALSDSLSLLEDILEDHPGYEGVKKAQGVLARAMR